MSDALDLAMAALIGAAVLMGILRLWRKRQRAVPAERGPARRWAGLVVLQIGAGAALILLLLPAHDSSGGAALVIATRHAPGNVALAHGERLIALPEARGAPGVERAPDLATALRRHPEARRIRIIGEGLAPRDRHDPRRTIIFEAPPLPQGLVRIALPGPMAPGQAFAVTGAIGALPTGRVELIDPAGAIIAQAPLKAGARFRLIGSARVAGLSVFALRLRDAAGRLIESLDVPIDAAPRPRPSVLVLAGAAGAESKFLRRWAQDAEIALSLEIDAGGGVQLGDPPTPLTRAALDALDLVAIDDRRWDSLGPAGQASLLAGTERGLGLLLRATGPLSPEVRRAWLALGFGWSNPAESAARSAPSAPEPRRLIALRPGQNTVPLADGLAAWVPHGQGRIGLLSSDDTYVLALTGRGDRHGQIWRTLISTLARAQSAPSPRILGLARARSRVVVCGLREPAMIPEFNREPSLLLLDPASGPARCAGYWPSQPGWHTVRSGKSATHFYVHPQTALPALAALEASAATEALAHTPAESGEARRQSGSPWLWFGLLLVLLAALWWLERARFAAKPTEPPNAPGAA